MKPLGTVFRRQAIALVCCVAASISIAQENPKTAGMAIYGCLPELEIRNPIDTKLASTGVLIDFLNNNASYHIANLGDISDHGEIFRWCIREREQVEYQKKFKEEYFKPLMRADTNRDGIADLLVVLASNGKFSVVIFQGLRLGGYSKPFWLIRDDPEIILGAWVESDGLVIPRYCVECDSNPPFLWIDSGYEVNGHLPGEVVCVEGGSVAHSAPSATTPVTWNIGKTQLAQIIRVGPRGEAMGGETQSFRWYQVRSNRNMHLIGYLPSSQILEGPGECE